MMVYGTWVWTCGDGIKGGYWCLAVDVGCVKTVKMAWRWKYPLASPRRPSLPLTPTSSPSVLYLRPHPCPHDPHDPGSLRMDEIDVVRCE